MNYLTHLWLAECTHTSPAGAILGDKVHGRLDAGLPPALALGIRIHRRIDAVTDHHPLSRTWRSSFAPGARRYAGIVLDLLCDHALALDWADYSAASLEDFAQRSAQALAAQGAWFKRHGDWTPQVAEFTRLLLSYREWAGIERAIARTATRLRQPQALINAASGSDALLGDIRSGLPALLTDLVGAAHTLQAEAATAARGSSPAASTSSTPSIRS